MTKQQSPDRLMKLKLGLAEIITPLGEMSREKKLGLLAMGIVDLGLSFGFLYALLSSINTVGLFKILGGFAIVVTISIVFILAVCVIAKLLIGYK